MAVDCRAGDSAIVVVSEVSVDVFGDAVCAERVCAFVGVVEGFCGGFYADFAGDF